VEKGILTGTRRLGMKCVRYAVLLTVIVSGYSALLYAAGFSGSLSPEIRKLPPTPTISSDLQPPVQKKIYMEQYTWQEADAVKNPDRAESKDAFVSN